MPLSKEELKKIRSGSHVCHAGICIPKPKAKGKKSTKATANGKKKRLSKKQVKSLSSKASTS